MSLTKIVATFVVVVTLTVAFSFSNQLQAQSGSRSGGIVGGAAGSGSRALPSVVTDFGGADQSYVAPQVEYQGAPVEAQYSPDPMVSSAPAVSSDCGCSAAPAPVVTYSAPAPQPVASPCGGGCGGGCGNCGGGCGNRNFGGLRRAPATGVRGGLFQRGRPCNGCN